MAEEAGRIGGRMRERRLELGLAQREVADRLPGNTEGKDVSRWERGHHRPQSDTLEAIAKALETDVADLYAGPVDERKAKGKTPDLFGSGDVIERLERIEAALAMLLENAGIEQIERAADELAQARESDHAANGERAAETGSQGTP